MEKGLKDLIEISQFFGKNKEYVIAGGGNTSYKNDEFLWIKASGIALADIAEDGFVRMSREKLKVISERSYSNNSTEREAQVKDDLAAAVDSTNGRRPSVETSMHDVIDYPFVIHTHPTVVNSLLCSLKAEKLSFEILGNDILFIPYTDPGYVLFKKVADEIQVFRAKNGFDPKIILLENHGIFVSAETTNEIKAIYSAIEKKIMSYIGLEILSDKVSSPSLNLSVFPVKLYKAQGLSEINLYNSQLIQQFVQSTNNFKSVETAFTPDHIVYCKSRYLFQESTLENLISESIKVFSNKNGYLPRIIGLQGMGLIICAENEKNSTIILELIQNMMKIAWLAQKLGSSKPMTETQIAFIENWEVENYRKQMSK